MSSSSAHSTVVLGATRSSWTAGSYNEQQYEVEPLRNLFDTVMEIEEIRFLEVPNGVLLKNISPNQPPQDLFSQLQVQFRLSGLPFAPKPVRIDLLCTDFQTQLEQEIVDAFTKYNASFRRWLLPKKLKVPPGASIDCRIVAPLGFAPGFDSTLPAIWVIYVGKITDEEGVHEVEVPYILQYNQLDPDPATGLAIPFQTANVPNLTMLDVPVENLKNPLYSPLNIQRIIARLYASQVAGGPPVLSNSLPGRDVLREIPDAMQFTLEDSYGYKIATQPTDLGVLVDVQRRGWTFTRQLGPLDYLKLRFTLNPNIAAAGYGNIGFLPSFGLIGYRTEELP